MSGIHNEILKTIQAKLIADLITNGTPGDLAVPGVVKLGPLQGDPNPDDARISLELYENDPDQEISGSGMGRSKEAWDDTVYETEIGGGVTWNRRFTVKARCLLVQSQEGLASARDIASTLRSRIEKSISDVRFNGLAYDGEYVCRGAMSENVRGSMVQLGGPPDAYDYQIKVRFEILTTSVSNPN